MNRLSVYAEARKAAAEHQWLQSERAGRDLGHVAAGEWTKRCWLQFYRWRFIQHLRGEIFWEEFTSGCFGLLSNRLAAPVDLLDEILKHVKEGAENLSLIVWAEDRLLPMDQVIQVLEALDINSQRLPPPEL